MKVIPLTQNTPEWLEFRKGKIGASDASTILGENPYKTAYNLWEEMVGIKQLVMTDAMVRGTLLEPEARGTYERMAGEEYFPIVAQSDEYEWMIASMDGMNSTYTKGVEIKCTGQKNHDIAKCGNVPGHYYAQLQHQMYVTGLQEIDYFSYRPEDDEMTWAIVKVKRDDPYIKDMIIKEREFYNGFLNFEAPDDREELCNRDLDEKWLEKAKEAASCKQAIDALTAVYTDLKSELITLSEGMSSAGGIYEMKRYVCKGNIDYTQVPELKGVNVEKYRKKGYEKWVFSVAKED